jgi:hypothetical protein
MLRIRNFEFLRQSENVRQEYTHACSAMRELNVESLEESFVVRLRDQR